MNRKQFIKILQMYTELSTYETNTTIMQMYMLNYYLIKRKNTMKKLSILFFQNKFKEIDDEGNNFG